MTRLELITECSKLGMGSFESPQVSLVDRLKICVRLSEISLDVNHLLSALVYLLQAFDDDLKNRDSSITFQDWGTVDGPPIEKILPQVSKQDIDFTKVFTFGSNADKPISRLSSEIDT